MAEVDYKELKKGGFMRQVQPDQFSLRLRVVAGQITAEQLLKMYEVAKKYGHGYVHLTSRQSVEIPFVNLADVEAIKKDLAEGGLQPGACGPRVRTITACQGSSICSHGLIETTELAKELDARYFAKDLPHKFKFGITGCRNNCLKAEENDVGIKGGLNPSWDKTACTFCGLCEAVCPTQAIQVDKKGKALAFDEEKCIYCGKCAKSCPTDAWQGESGYILSFGGLFGNRIAIGENVLPLITSKEKLFEVIDTTLSFFQKHAKQGERFRLTLDRVGWDKLKKELEAVL